MITPDVDEESIPLKESNNSQLILNGNSENISLSLKNKVIFLTSNIILYVLLLIFVIFLLLDLNHTFQMNAKLLYTPLLSFLILVQFFINCLICAYKGIFFGIAKYFLLFSLNAILFTAIVLVIFLVIIRDGIYFLPNYILFTPIFALMGLFFFVICFIFPGLVDKSIGRIFEAVLSVFHYFAISTFFILFLLKMNGEINFPYFKMVIIEEIVLLINLAIIFWKINLSIDFFENLGILIGLMEFIILTALRIDEILYIKWEILFIGLFLAIISFFSKNMRLYTLVFKKNK